MLFYVLFICLYIVTLFMWAEAVSRFFVTAEMWRYVSDKSILLLRFVWNVQWWPICFLSLGHKYLKPWTRIHLNFVHTVSSWLNDVYSLLRFYSETVSVTRSTWKHCTHVFPCPGRTKWCIEFIFVTDRGHVAGDMQCQIDICKLIRLFCEYD